MDKDVNWQDHRVLVIDDDLSRSHDLHVVLDFLGEHVEEISSTQWPEIKQELLLAGTDDEHQPCVLLVGQLGDSLSIETLLTDIHSAGLVLPVMLLGGEPLADDFDPILKAHVISHISMPSSYNQMLNDLHRAQAFFEQNNSKLKQQNQRDIQLFRSLVGTSRAVQSVRTLMGQVANKEVTVLITGESGTGKEVVARNLHYHSQRRDKPFVPVNCGAIPAELLESELFGHEKGAFTGAISTRAGRFEMAQGGTLFLDEIGDMPLSMQVKILRVLQERTFERVGSNKTQEADVRIVAATHKNLEQMIEEGTFREDLYYRLNVFPIDMPALRERSEDIPVLINELVTRLEHEKRGSIRFNSASILSLCQHQWAGNVRELANLVERMAILYPYGVVGINELPEKFRHLGESESMLAEHNQSFLIPKEKESDDVSGQKSDILDKSFDSLSTQQAVIIPSDGIDLKGYMTTLESSLIRQALDDSRGVVARAAERLHIRRTTLVEKMRKYGLQREELPKV